MTCPHCRAALSPGDLTCPSCQVPLEALAADTRLYHRYRIVRALSRSGGVRYLARDEQAGGEVLIDEFFPAQSRRLGTLAILPTTSAPQRAQWLARAQAWSQTPVPGVRTVREVFEQFGTTYVVSLPPEGLTLRAEVERRGPLSAADVTALLVSAAEAAQQLIPPDLGLLSPDAVTLTQAGPLLELNWAAPPPGSALPPEYLRGESLESWPAAAYAMGAAAAFALTGHEVPDAARRALGTPVVSLPVGTPGPLAEAVHRCLDLQPARRPVSPAALVRAVHGQRGGEVSASVAAARTLQVHGSWVTHVALNGAEIISAGADQQVRLTPVEGGTPVRIDGLRGRPVGMALQPAGLVVADTAGWMHLWRDHRLQSVKSSESTELLTAYNETQVLTVGSSMTLTLWQVDGLQPRGQQRIEGDVITAVTALTSGVIVYGTLQGQIVAFNAAGATFTPLLPPQLRKAVRCLVGDGTELFYACGGDFFRLGQASPVVTVSDDITAVARHVEGSFLLTAGRTLYRWRPGGPLTALHGATGELRCVASSEEWIVAGTAQGEIVVLSALSDP